MSEKMTCGQALVRLLEQYGVDIVFGIPGEHTLELYRGLSGSKIRHIRARHEQGAGFMADGYARASGKPGVCMLITGPGVTNASTALGQAYADSVPLLMISSDNPTYTLGKGWGCLHEISDQRQVTAPLAARSAVALSPEDLPELIGQAFAVFASARPRPVHIAIPTDVLVKPARGEWAARRPGSRSVPDPEALRQAAAMLRDASRPALYIGGGATAAGQALQAIAEHLQSVVITTNNGKGALPDSYPLNLGASSWRRETQELLARADVVLAIGTELSATDSFVEKLDLPGRLLRVDIDPGKINDLYEAEVGIVGDAAAAANGLLGELRQMDPPGYKPDLLPEIEEVRRQILSGLSAVERQHAVVLAALRRALPGEALVMADITQIVYTGSFVFPVERPGCWHYAAGFCTLGFSLPGAIGARLAAPQRPVAVLTGDGGFQFTMQELITAVELQLPIPILIWNNAGLQEIQDGMRRRGIEPLGVGGLNPDFRQLAKAFGANWAQPEGIGQLEAAVATALQAAGPTLIEVRQDADWLVEAAAGWTGVL